MATIGKIIATVEKKLGFESSDLFPQGTFTLIALQLAIFIIPIAICLIGLGAGIGWLLWK